RQKDSGFWAHEYPNAFCTAAMLWGLLAARQAGADVPTEMITRGIAALQSARYDDGRFQYGGAAVLPLAEGEPAPRRPRRASNRVDSSARMPVCEGALYAFGASDETRLRAAL